ncbi:YciI family protein [Cellulomonas sp. URHB0016]
MTKYLVLLYEDERIWAEADDAQQAEWFGQHREYSAGGAEHGVTFLASEALLPVATATTLRRPDGTTTITEGPFAETAEQLGGFYLVEAPDVDTVVKHAHLLPSHYTVEVREIMQL